MKDIIFNEEQLCTLNEIGSELFRDEHDPRSSAYIRKLNRPFINWCKVFFYLLFSCFLAVVVIIIIKHFAVTPIESFLMIAGILLLYLFTMLKRIIICAIKIYQRYAPDSVRNKCRFEPSCSEYMILAIEKYGLFKGIYKGINRLKRCNTAGGGFDFP